MDFSGRVLRAEIATVLDAGYLRGAGLWHLGVALFADPQREIAFLTLDTLDTLDVRQRDIARRLGFSTR